MRANRVLDLSNYPTFTAINLLSDPGAIGGPVVVPQCAQIVLNWTLESGHTAHNVLYGNYSGAFAGTVAQANNLFSALAQSASMVTLLSHFTSTTSITGLSIRDVNTANQALILSTLGASTGTGTGAGLPNEVALVVTERTALAGRANRGRFYVPGWTLSSSIAGNIAAPAVVTDLQNWANTFPNAFSSNGYQLAIGQKARAAYTGRTGTQHPARPAQFQRVTSLQVRDNHWDSQRRRGLK